MESRNILGTSVPTSEIMSSEILKLQHKQIIIANNFQKKAKVLKLSNLLFLDMCLEERMLMIDLIY